MADAVDSKSTAHKACGFKSHLSYHNKEHVMDKCEICGAKLASDDMTGICTDCYVEANESYGD